MSCHLSGALLKKGECGDLTAHMGLMSLVLVTSGIDKQRASFQKHLLGFDRDGAGVPLLLVPSSLGAVEPPGITVRTSPRSRDSALRHWGPAVTLSSLYQGSLL